jgi:hypothetical protein
MPLPGLKTDAVVRLQLVRVVGWKETVARGLLAPGASIPIVGDFLPAKPMG